MAAPSGKISPFIPDTVSQNELLGKGTFGSVYKALDTRSERTYALKVSRSYADSQPQRVGAEEEPLIPEAVEGDIYAILNGSPHFPRCFACEIKPDRVRLLLECCPGKTLSQQTPKKEKLDISQIAYVAQKLSLAILFLKGREIIHCDITTNNVLYDKETGELKLFDFGNGHIIGQNLPVANTTAYEYKSPTVLHKKRKYSFEADVWSLGCTIIELLVPYALYPFFCGKSLEKRYKPHLTEAQPKLREFLEEEKAAIGSLDPNQIITLCHQGFIGKETFPEEFEKPSDLYPLPESIPLYIFRSREEYFIRFKHFRWEEDSDIMDKVLGILQRTFRWKPAPIEEIVDYINRELAPPRSPKKARVERKVTSPKTK